MCLWLAFGLGSRLLLNAMGFLKIVVEILRDAWLYDEFRRCQATKVIEKVELDEAYSFYCMVYSYLYIKSRPFSQCQHCHIWS